MKARLAAACALVVVMGKVYGGQAPNACYPAERFMDVTETVQVQVPVTEYVDEQYPVQCTRMVPFEREVMVPRGRWVTERRTVPCTRTVYENETYTVREARWENRPERRMRTATRTVRENEPRTVTETVFQQTCDPVTGQVCRTPRTVNRTIMVPVSRRVCVQEPYTTTVRTRVMVPVTRTRRVARSVPSTREVTDRRWVSEMVPQRVTEMRAVQETRMETRKKAVYSTRTENRQVVKRVPVPMDACQ